MQHFEMFNVFNTLGGMLSHVLLVTASKSSNKKSWTFLLLNHNYWLLVNFKAFAHLHLQHLFLYNNLLITSGIFSPVTKQYYCFPEVRNCSDVLIGVLCTSSDHIFTSKKWFGGSVCVYVCVRARALACMQERESTYMAAFCFSHIWGECEYLAIVSTLLKRIGFLSLLSYSTLSCEKTILWVVYGCKWICLSLPPLSYKWM
jgi:hypothetical protein